MRKDVTIKAKKVGSKIEFEMEQAGQYTEILVFNKTNDNIKKTEDYEIVFGLRNEAGADLEFVQDKSDVIWISKGSDVTLPKCPKNGNGNSNSPFTVTDVQAKTLTVRNPDNDINFYKFALRFVDKANNGAIVTFDPIFGNQNGGLASKPPGGGTASIAFVGGTGLLVGAVLTMMAYGVGLFA